MICSWIGARLCVADVQKPAPNFQGVAVVQKDFKNIQLSDYKGKYLVLFFYPLDLYVSLLCWIESVWRNSEYFSFIQQYIRVSDGDYCLQWSHQRFPSPEYGGCWCFRWFAFQPFGMDQHTKKGKKPIATVNSSELTNVSCNAFLGWWFGWFAVSIVGWYHEEGFHRLWCADQRGRYRFAWPLYHWSKRCDSSKNDQRFTSWSISWRNIEIDPGDPAFRRAWRRLALTSFSINFRIFGK